MSLSSSAPPYLGVEARSRQMLGLYRWVYGCPCSHVHRPSLELEQREEQAALF
jgi:hypothetical protein